MAKEKNDPKKGSKENPLTPEDLEGLKEVKPPYIIMKATITDDICDYVYQVTDGTGIGDKHKVDGSGIIKDSMIEAFKKLHVHLAAIDGIFKHSNTEVEDIDMFHNHEFTDLYRVNGFEIIGDGESEQIIIQGNKFLDCVHGRMKTTTPKIPMDNLSSYKWYNELKAASNTLREEVKLYKEGNYDPVIKEEVEKKGKGKFKQITIGDQINEEQNNQEDQGNEGSGSSNEEGETSGLTRRPTAKELMDGIQTDENGQVAVEEKDLGSDFDSAKL